MSKKLWSKLKLTSYLYCSNSLWRCFFYSLEYFSIESFDWICLISGISFPFDCDLKMSEWVNRTQATQWEKIERFPSSFQFFWRRNFIASYSWGWYYAFHHIEYVHQIILENWYCKQIQLIKKGKCILNFFSQLLSLFFPKILSPINKSEDSFFTFLVFRDVQVQSKIFNCLLW